MVTRLMWFVRLWTRPTRQYSVYISTDRHTTRGFSSRKTPYDELILNNEPKEKRDSILGQYFPVFKAIFKKNIGEQCSLVSAFVAVWYRTRLALAVFALISILGVYIYIYSAF